MNQDELNKERMEETAEEACEACERTEETSEKEEQPETEEKAAEAESTEDAKDAENGKDEPEESADAKYLRLMADFQNYKRRVEKEKGDIYTYANEKLITELLAVIDNFERALVSDSTDAGFAEGMNMIFKQLTGVLEKAGLEEIKALGEDFDPNFHNAVMTEDNADYESGKVTEVMQKGYMLNKKVIRPSMVKVNN